MKQVGMRWGRQGFRTLLPGFGLWAVLAAAGGIYAGVVGRPVLPAIVTLDEWVAAVFFIAPLTVYILRIARSGLHRQTAQDRFIGVATQVGWAGAAVFLMALITRAIFGLGWKPF